MFQLQPFQSNPHQITHDRQKQNTKNTQVLPLPSLTALQQLRCECSQANFQSIPFDTFRRRLEELVVGIIHPLLLIEGDNKSDSSIRCERYEGCLVERLLVHPGGLDWERICASYDASYRSSRRSRNDKRSSSHHSVSKDVSSCNTFVNSYDATLLEELLRCLTVPSVSNVRHSNIVLIVSPSIVYSLIRVVFMISNEKPSHHLQNNSLNSTYASLPSPAQVYILRCINGILQRFPSITIMEALEPILKTIQSPCRNTIAVTNWLCKIQPSIGPDICKIIVRMFALRDCSKDEWSNPTDFENNHDDSECNESILRVCEVSNKGNLIGRKRVMKRNEMIYMHEASSNPTCLEETRTMMIISTSENHGGESVLIKRRKVEKTSYANTLPMKLEDISQIPLEWLISTFNSVNLVSKREFNFALSFHEVITIACSDPRNIFAKLSILALCKVKGKESGFKIILRRIFEGYLVLHMNQDVASSESLLRMYTEIIIDSHGFDRDVNLCVYAINPLLDVIMKLKDDEDNTSTSAIISITLLARAIACIYCHRYKELAKDARVVHRLAFLFGDENVFTRNSSIPYVERDLYTRCFQYTGVMSPFHNPIETDDSGDSSSERWPFETTSRMIFSTKSMPYARSFLTSNDISDCSIARQYPQIVNQDNDAVENKDPLLDYIYDEHILRLIAGYLNYRSISKFGQVSKLFESISSEQSIWCNLYKRRWNNCVEGLSFDPILYCWKNIFIDRWKAERNIRGKRSNSGFRYCLCPRVGCIQIFRSESSKLKHIAKHEKEDSKIVERELKILGYI